MIFFYLKYSRNNKQKMTTVKNSSSNVKNRKKSFPSLDTTFKIRSSQENHVNRIRSANSRRLSNVLSSSTNVNSQQSSKDVRLSKENSVSNSSSSSKENFWKKRNNASNENVAAKENIYSEASTSEKSELEKPKSLEILENFQKQVNTKNPNNPENFEPLSENNQASFDKEQEHTYEEFSTSEKAHSLKDAVVLNWLHVVRCPFLGKEKHETKQKIVEICKKSTNISTHLPENIKASSLRMGLKSSIKQNEISVTSDVYSNAIDNGLEARKKEQCSNEVERHEVEMHVSELNKLQITLNPNSFSPEDAAVVIWIENVPEAFFTPKYSRRLSIAPQLQLELPNYLTEETGSQTETKFESQQASKQDAYSPSITVLKNVALDTKFDLKNLSEIKENLIYFKECDINHVKMEANKDQHSFESITNENDE